MARRVFFAVALLGCSVNSSGTATDIDFEDTSATDTSAGGADTTPETSTIFDGDDPDTTMVVDTMVVDTKPPPVDSIAPIDTGVAMDTMVADTAPMDVMCPKCPTLATCVGGACTCPPNADLCSAGCIDLKVDPNRCGNCDLGLPCAQGSMCSNNVCTCQPGLTLCGGVCVDVKGHASVCGSCSTPCGSNQRCVSGKCVPAGSTTCPAARPDECPGDDGRKSCFNFKIDPMHCGGCATDKRCDSDEFCVDGGCKGYEIGIGCTSCPCANCETLLPKSTCCSSPPGWPAGRVVCVEGTACPVWLP
jgi:hypothetical protein